jgi:hypothetical protein
MEPVTHPTTNLVLKPGDDSPEDCADLPITRGLWFGTPSLLSFWKPSLAELALLNEGRPVLIAVAGNSLPPMSVTVDKPHFHGEL